MKKTYRILWILLIASVIGHYFQADSRRMVPPLTGETISAPNTWQQSNVKRFRLGTYNIRRSKGKDNVRDITRSAEVIRGADIVGLNEVSGTLFYGLTNQAQQLGELLNMGWLFAPTQYRWYQEYSGNGFLSGFPVKKWLIEPLIYGIANSHSPRNLTTVQIDIAGRNVTILSTHLDRGEIREQQLKFILDRFQATEGPAIIMGDFNTKPNHPYLQAVINDPRNTDAVAVTMDTVAVSIKDQRKRLDYIITRGFDVTNGGMTPKGISDHPYYWVELAFSK